MLLHCLIRVQVFLALTIFLLNPYSESQIIFSHVIFKAPKFLPKYVLTEDFFYPKRNSFFYKEIFVS